MQSKQLLGFNFTVGLHSPPAVQLLLCWIICLLCIFIGAVLVYLLQQTNMLKSPLGNRRTLHETTDEHVA